MKRKLNEINDIPAKTKICKTCYKLSKAPHVSTNESDLSIYRKGVSSHNRCTFSCKNISNLVLILNKIRYNLVKNYKFFASHYACMCNEHVGVNN